MPMGEASRGSTCAQDHLDIAVTTSALSRRRCVCDFNLTHDGHRPQAVHSPRMLYTDVVVQRSKLLARLGFQASYLRTVKPNKRAGVDLHSSVFLVTLILMPRAV
jgi:hypothetical protein